MPLSLPLHTPRFSNFEMQKAIYPIVLTVLGGILDLAMQPYILQEIWRLSLISSLY